MYYGNKVFKLLQQCSNKCHIPGLESFKAEIKNGFVLVECCGLEVFMESFIRGNDSRETRITWKGAVDVAAGNLEALEIDLSSVEMLKRTLGSCILLEKSERSETQYNESCEGFGKLENGDEPCEFCQNCNFYFLDREPNECN